MKNDRLRMKPIYLTVLFLVASNFNGFYLIPNYVGSIRYSDIHLIFVAMFWMYGLYINNFRINKRKDGTFFYILFPIVIIFVSAIMAQISYDQPLLMAIQAQRSWVGSLLLFFPVYTLLRKEIITRGKLFRYLAFGCLFVIMIGFIQAIIGSRFVFLNAIINIYSNRSVLARVYISDIFPKFLFAYGVSMLFQEKRKFKAMLYIIISLLFVFLVIQSRMSLGSMLVAGIFTVLFLDIKKSIKYPLVIISTIIICTIFFTSIGSVILESVFHFSEQYAGDFVRENARQFYMSSLDESNYYWLLGKGYPSLLWAQSVSGSGYDRGFYFVDNGFIAILFYYGILGAVWFVLSYIKFIKHSINLNKKTGNMMFFVYYIMQVVGLYTLQPDCFDSNNNSTIFFVIITSVLLYEVKKIGYYRKGKD